MSIHINLLPEARLIKLRNQGKKRTYATIAGLVGGLVLATIIIIGMLQVFLISTYAVNEGKINSLNKELVSTKDMEQKSATLQANLASFYELNKNRTYASRIFTNLFEAIPENVSISSVEIDDQDIVTVTGVTDSFADVAKFAESLKQYNVNYKPQADLERKPIFTEVSISSVSKDGNTTKVNYSISFKVDRELIKGQQKV